MSFEILGAEKSWYAIPSESRLRFESTAAAYFTEDERKCKEYLRHKTYILAPGRLKEGGLSFTMAVQKAGEFIVTFPGAYHAGFNHGTLAWFDVVSVVQYLLLLSFLYLLDEGFNIAEATNFVTERWIPAGLKAKVCRCRPSSVHIEVHELESSILRDKKRKSLLQQKTESADTELLRCSCGMRVEFKKWEVISRVHCSGMGRSSDTKSQSYSDAIESGCIFQCCECDCWSHTVCIFDDPPNVISPNSTCQWCPKVCGSSSKKSECRSKGKKSKSLHSNDISMSYKSQKRQAKCEVDKQTKHSSHEKLGERHCLLVTNAQEECNQVETHKRTSNVAGNGDDDGLHSSSPPTKRRKGVVEKGVLVRATLPDRKRGAPYTVTIEGVVTDVYDGQFRLHQMVV